MPCFPTGASVEPVTPVSNKKGSVDPRIKPRKICLAPERSPAPYESPQGGARAKAATASDVLVIEADKKGVSLSPATSGSKSRRVAFVTLGKGTDKSNLSTENCPDSSAPQTSSVDLAGGGVTLSPVPSGAKPTGPSVVGLSPATVKGKHRRVDFVTLSGSNDNQPDLQQANGGAVSSPQTASLGVKPVDPDISMPPATQGPKPRRVDFVTLSNNAVKLPRTDAGNNTPAANSQASKDTDTDPMEVQSVL